MDARSHLSAGAAITVLLVFTTPRPKRSVILHRLSIAIRPRDGRPMENRLLLFDGLHSVINPRCFWMMHRTHGQFMPLMLKPDRLMRSGIAAAPRTTQCRPRANTFCNGWLTAAS